MLDKKKSHKDVLEESLTQELELISLKWGRIIIYLILVLILMVLAWEPGWL